MKFYGDINLLDNEMQAMVLQMETNFPTVPVVGRIVFKNKRVYICAELPGGIPAWVPLTNEIDTYIHTQSTASTTWTITHNMKTGTPLVQAYDTNQQLIIPDTITIVDNNTVTLTVASAVAGRAIVMYGSITGGTSNETPSYEHYQTTPATTWVIPHGMGYYPIVRVFVGGTEIQPLSIIHDSAFQTTITFSSVTAGYAKLV